MKKILNLEEDETRKMKKAEKLKKSIRRKKFLIKKLVLGAVFGYLGGVVLTFIWFLFLTTQINVPLTKSTRITCFVAVILTLGLSYNKTARAITILILPNFFSSKGRAALIAYIFVLAAAGPTKNILGNIEVLSKSIACGQEQLKEALEGMLDVVKRPIETIKQAIKSALKAIKKTMVKIGKVLKRIRDLVFAVLKGIRDAFRWLANIVNVCNKKIGTPFQRCMNMVDEAVDDCRSKLGFLKYLCEVATVLKGICYSVKFIDYVCILVDFISDAIVGTITKKLEEFTNEIRRMFYVSVKFHHKFSFNMTVSKSLKQVGEDMIADIRERSKSVYLVFGWLEILGSLLFLRIVLKAYSYRYKYLTSNSFDNNFITKDFIHIDEQRKKLNKNPVLPLTRKEKMKYFKITSFSLTKSEKLRLARSAMFLVITTIQLISICFADYALYWLLWQIRIAGLQEAGLEVPPLISVNVTGQSFLSDIYSGIVNSFRPMADIFNIDPIPCLPNPKYPNLSKYFEIGFLIVLSWLLLIFEPYGLRVRQIVMRSLHPERSKERAIWLHSQILMKRTSFIKFARRKARQKFLKDDSKDAFSFMDWLRARTERWWIMRKILGKRQIKNCMLCSSTFSSEEDKIACSNPGCNGMYCKECYTELNNMCFLCKEPVEYGDYSDISEEKGSSDLDDVTVKLYCRSS